jgi:hypothetical protein
LKARLDQLLPDNGFTAADLQECQRWAPSGLWRQIQLSLQRENVSFSDQDFLDERSRVHNLTDPQIAVLMRAIARFAVGEKVVEDELQPLIDFYRRGDPSDRWRALFVMIQQAEEKIHAGFFGRYREIVFGVMDDREKDLRMGTLKERYLNTEDLYSRPFRRFFTTRLPDVLGRLHKAERSTFGTFREMAAIACYHVFAEGVVAETAYFAFEKALATKDGDTLPTILKGIRMIKGHESTHIAFGVLRLREMMEGSWLSRVVLKSVFLANCLMNVPSVIGIVGAVHREHPGSFPFPLNRLELAAEGLKQFKSRFWSVLSSRGS